MPITTASDEQTRELELLESLHTNPEARQVDIAAHLGVAVGTVNWLVKRMVSKGYLKVKRIGRWQWRYLLTPRGLARKARLTQQYLKLSMELYRSTRQEARQVVWQVKQRGFDRVRVEGGQGDDLVDVCRLTCLEEQVTVVDAGNGGNEGVPLLRIAGRLISLEWPRVEEATSE